jgi:hypothetical protein
MLIEQDEIQETEIGSSENEKEIEVVLSIFALSSNPYLTALRFKGKVGGRDICALIDSGSTSNLVNLQSYKELNVN